MSLLSDLPGFNQGFVQSNYNGIYDPFHQQHKAQAMTTPLWLENARAFEKMHISERPGPEAHPLVQAFFQYTQLRGTPAGSSDETPWCSAFACACMELSGIQSPRHALAHSWLKWGEEIKDLREGAVLVFKDTNHVAFCNSPSGAGTHIATLGGNQGNAVSVKLYPRERLISIRWPKQ